MNPLHASLIALLIVLLNSCKQEPSTATAPPAEKRHRILDTGNLISSKTSDFGGPLTQSFRSNNSGNLSGLRIFIEGRENPRDLLVLVRAADTSGYPARQARSSPPE